MPKTWLVLLIAFSTWALSAVVATLPLTDDFQSRVPDTVLVLNDPFLDQPMLDLTTAKKYLLQSLVYYPSHDSNVLLDIAKQVKHANTWDSLVHIYESLPEQKQELQIAARYG